MAPRKILFTGATSYVGGSVLAALLKSQDTLVQQLSITALVRKKEQADILNSKGVNTVIFRDLDDSEDLKDLAAEHDVVIHTASGFHRRFAVALVKGLGQRKARDGSKVHYIHTSGTWNLAGSNTTYPGPTDFGEAGLFQHLVNLPAKYLSLQREALLAAISAVEPHGVEIHALLPPDVYGQGTGLFTQHTPQLFELVKFAIDKGNPEYIGNGRGGAGHVHITDFAALYELILRNVLAGEHVPSGKEGLFFAETGYHNWLDVAKLIGEVGFSNGALVDPEPKSIMESDAAQRWNDGRGLDEWMIRFSFHLEYRTVPGKAFELGWTPNKTDEDWKAWIEEVFRLVLEKKV
ncbi:nad dependent epimerase dehydratase family [Fusarium albosuccineum]|uniref:Nad dependent epimerase dehydratase family n=1 Tax=Fusarium albosuccineum TaxID=1237068 RepID=A0A8H4LNI3_9HYPO|nr:nad dependent epimerase dehydratase family [Fusarium albosuccineum]